MGADMNTQGQMAFQVANQTANNFSQSFQKRKDENTIETILAEANATGDAKVLQDSIGKILSGVSPERQGAAIKYLENAYNNIQKKSKEKQKTQAAERGGYDPFAPPQVQAAQVNQNAKNQRINDSVGAFNNSNANPTNNENPKEKKQQLLSLTGHPDREISERAKAELKNLENTEKNNRADARELRKETLPLKQEIINRANLSRESIRNKNHLLEIIDRNNLDDPTFAVFAESLPAGLGKRLLSDDTIEYKGGLVDEFSDLKNIFKGATRVKEVEIYENKLPDIYLTDSQKKAILKSRINSSKIDILREEAASEIEEKYPNITALQFSKKVDEVVKPKVDALFNTVWGDQKAVLDQAESRKKIPLDYDDPEGREILEQIMKEAGGDRKKAREIANKKGYTIGK